MAARVEFVWDPAKNAANFAKHGIRFEDAAELFRLRYVRSLDGRWNYGEPRLVARGVIGDAWIVVVYTDRGRARRIISARFANRKERTW